METITKSESLIRRGELLNRMFGGEVFIHPTDTIYGLGCNATNEKAVQKIRDIKERQDTPFSVWAPNKEWILKNCVINEEGRKWVDELPGYYTLILKLKNKNAVAKNVCKGDTIGVRIPQHWFHAFVENLGIPIVTTSANKTGKPFMTSIDDLDAEVRTGVMFAIYEGEKKGKPSKIVNVAEGGKVITR